MKHLVWLFGVMALSAQVAAHPVWMLPSEFNASSNESQWITVDGTAAHAVFGFDKPIGLDNVTVYNPKGEPRGTGPYFKGRRRSVFDVELDMPGTYKVELRNPYRYATTYVIGKRNTQRRITASKPEVAAQVPAKASQVVTYATQNIAAFFVTRQAPTDAVLAITGQGLELKPLTHPSDVVVGEAARFQFLFNGQPVKGLKAELVPHGTPWRDQRLQQNLEADKEGIITFTPTLAGPHLLSTSIEQEGDGILADKVAINYLLTFEALPE